VSEPPTAPPETILFVEDETLVRMDMAEFLRECGYRVYEAATAKEAIEALQAKFVVDLVFTDINLPDDMNGLELGEWTLRERPGVKVLVTTGDASRTVDISQNVGLVLAKPYTGRDLLDRVRQALTKPSGDGGADRRLDEIRVLRNTTPRSLDHQGRIGRGNSFFVRRTAALASDCGRTTGRRETAAQGRGRVKTRRKFANDPAEQNFSRLF
jgi:CheY-like chemotaxis protein